MKRNITALILLNVGVFVIAAAFLPKPPGGYTYSYDGPISQFFGYLSHSRMHWHIPFLVTLHLRRAISTQAELKKIT